jgi:predicted dehydrogenase
MPLLAAPAAEVPDWWSDAAQGGGWLGAHATHVVDQVLSTLGPFEGVSASLPLVSEHDWSAEDSYAIHFRLRSGAAGIMHETAGDWGSPVVVTRIAGSKGTVWSEGDAVLLADASGTNEVSVPEDLMPVPPDPPPAELMVTAYDLMHSTGIDLEPYTRLAATFRDRILGRPIPKDPPPATFVDGVAGMQVLDAIRQSAAEHTWVSIT